MQERLFRIVQMLMKRRHMTARELAEELEVSTRTIYRDLDALTMGGVPVYTQKGENGGIFLDEHYVLSSTLINAQEQEAILQGLNLLQTTQARNTKRSSEKLEALFQRSYPQIINIDFHGWGRDDRQEYLFDTLYQAIHMRRLVSFVYYNSMKEKRFRTVEPYQLLFKEQAWYLSAYCREREAFRIFKFNRITDLKITDDTYVPRTLPKEPAPKLEYDHRHPIVLHFDKSIWFQLADSFAVEMIKELPDCYEVVIECSQEDWLVSWLLTFEDQLEVISPPSMRERMYKKLVDMKKIYE